MLNTLTFAGCMLNNPLLGMARENRVAKWSRKLGFTRTPFALSPQSARQLLEIYMGGKPVPPDLWHLAYMGQYAVTTAEQRRYFSELDCIAIEYSTLTEYRIGSVILNANRIIGDLVKRVSEIPGMPDEAASKWRDGLTRFNEEMRAEAAVEILAHFPSNSERDRHDRSIVEAVRAVPSPLSDIETSITEIRDAFPGVPVMISLHHLRYMKDGRAIDWPTEMNAEIVATANRLSIPIFDSADVVRHYGTETALAADLRHWMPEFERNAGQEILRFIEGHCRLPASRTKAG